MENYILIHRVKSLIEGVWMRLSIIVGVILVVVLCCSPTLALSAKVYSLSEENITIDLGPGFEISQKIVDNSNNGSFDQNLLLTNSQAKGVAYLQIIDLYDDALKSLDPEAISGLWLQGGMGSAIKDGGKPSGNWSVVNSNGKNTTVHAVYIGNTSLKYMGNTVYFANWKVGRSMYVGMMSFFDKNVTKQIVKTLAVS
jgi:hypothetical protein